MGTMGRRTLRSIIPDTLYMIEDGNVAEGCSSQQPNHLGLYPPSCYARANEPLKPCDIVVDPETLTTMQFRLKKLQSAHHRSLNLVSRERATRYLRLRVVREFGFPDYVAEMLETTNPVVSNSATQEEPLPFGASGVDSSISKLVRCGGGEGNPSDGADSQQKPLEQLCGKMPDIALTASDQFRLVEDIMDLDLGDGASNNSGRRSHHMSMLAPPESSSGGTQSRRTTTNPMNSYQRQQQLPQSHRINPELIPPTQEQPPPPRLDVAATSRQSHIRETIYTSHYL